MQQQQQHADYDLLAVFNDETKASEAASKLQKEGFDQDEVFQLPAGIVGTGQFRDHGPSSDRASYFLQTQRRGPKPATVMLFAVIFGVVLAALMFVAHFAITSLPEPLVTIIGGIVGVIIGFVVAMTRTGRVIGDIGQHATRPAPVNPPVQGDNTVVAVRLADADNVVRKSRARAILINNQGRIDRSVTRKE